MITKTWNHGGKFTYADAEFCKSMGCQVHITHDTKEVGVGLQIFGKRFVEITTNTEQQELILVLKYCTDLYLVQTTYHEEKY